MLLHTTNDNSAYTRIWNCDYDNKIAINKKQRKISQNFQDKMCFSLLHYTSKNGKKGPEWCQYICNKLTIKRK